jgi:hypothetical protein
MVKVEDDNAFFLLFFFFFNMSFIYQNNCLNITIHLFN